MQFSAKLIVPTAGTYTLYAQSDDGSRIYVNGQLVVDNDGLHASIEKQGDITLSAGEHDIIVQFFEYDRGDNLTVSWAGPNIQKQAIPLSALATGSVATDEADEIVPTDTADEVDPTDTTVTTTVTGTLGMINYEYFEGGWTSVPNFDSLVPVAQGEQVSFSLAPKQIDDNYGFRFAAYVEVPADGLYTFYLASDDGSRLHINGQLLVDNDGLHASREYNASQYLTAGTHHVLVEYFERTGQDTLDVSWSATSMAKQLLQNATLSAAPFAYTDTDISVTASATTGVNFEYFEGTWATLPNFDLLTPVSTGELDQFTLPASNGELFYGYRFTSQIQIDEAGLYTFYTLSNDGSQLHIDDNLIVDNNGKHGAVEEQGAVTLSAGLHDITVTYFQSGGTEALEVYWSSANMVKQIIDNSVLFTP